MMDNKVTFQLYYAKQFLAVSLLHVINRSLCCDIGENNIQYIPLTFIPPRKQVCVRASISVCVKYFWLII